MFERADALSEIGAGLQISPNAGRILDNLGLAAALDREATRPEAIDMRAARTGRIIVSLPLSRAAPYRTLHRADLLSILEEAVLADPFIELRLGEPIDDIRSTAEAVSFATPTRREEASLLVGADGIRSSVRSFVADETQPQPTGRTAWRTTVAADAAPEELPRNRTTVFLGDRTHVVVYPIRSGTEINIVAIVEEDWRGEGWSEPGDATWLSARFRSVAPLLRDVIAAGSDWTRWCLATVDPSGRWQRGRAVLVGDAAHAMLPFLAQGAAMAIEDAAILAHSLTVSYTGLDRYEALRRPRVSRVWQAAQQSGTIYHMGYLAAPFRDTIMKVLGTDRLLARYDWIYGWHPPTPRQP